MTGMDGRRRCSQRAQLLTPHPDDIPRREGDVERVERWQLLYKGLVRRSSVHTQQTVVWLNMAVSDERST